ncbi:cation diffusion facilitator family transporter [Methanolobus bombayensis]|uniref:cation diffusion facilitator family transporter n=1 Tax=Methanolobus bombayensis TaxID=38023 RepID=UPI001AE53B91|nr:cation diffusion facilitator family transporter [Methanolobus bombayensis]MBP1909137.1 cation diffusion facilitator family transporter [Methanolobus bombayensis]
MYDIESRFRQIRNVMIYVLFLNLAVSFAKIAYGMYTDVLSMQSDGYHSLFDGVSNIVGLIGIHIAAKPPDKEHPYGHRKFETLASILIAVILAVVAFEIVHSAFNRFGNGNVPEVTAISFAIMIGTMCVNYAVTTYEHKKGTELNSEVLIADSAHTRSDIYVSLSVIMGLVAIHLGYPVIDPVVSVLIALVILHAGAEIIYNSVSILADESRIDTEKIAEVVCNIEGVIDCHKIRTRGPPGNVFVDLHVEVDPEMTTYKSHTISHIVQYRIRENFEGIEDVLVHIEPAHTRSI